ncbi:hypothetical protein FDA94_26730 [Herbidospora galbida]|uniref:Uncharacterized protein n=1 Tax=Herbidospora galbida TaxID=2575442 RepID=A0A4U3MAY1_9ACTN|nr:hypothetical protein [Herbidospora galbida]TKK85264.1 hypothetical protein FDA94_26730 [Herbidospora galbida]
MSRNRIDLSADGGEVAGQGEAADPSTADEDQTEGVADRDDLHEGDARGQGLQEVAGGGPAPALGAQRPRPDRLFQAALFLGSGAGR